MAIATKFNHAKNSCYTVCSHNGLQPILSHDSSTATEKQQIVEVYWIEGLQKVYWIESQPPQTRPWRTCNKEQLWMTSLTPHNGWSCISPKKLKKGKKSGSDGKPAGVWKEGGGHLVEALLSLILDIWSTEHVQHEWRNGVLIPIFKKGDRITCSNYRGIALLCTAGKVLSRIIISRLASITEEILLEAQCGFRPNTGHADMIFILWQLQKKSRAQNRIAFIDLTNAYDTVNRVALWQLLLKLGIPCKVVNIIRSFHQGITGVIRLRNVTTPKFTIRNGLWQGCVIAPNLFNLML